ncbi:MAG: carbohydrate-binding protein [Oligoflexus sp.]|nr:carbohydrate-binding protein [Oligoflexus sp.]
MRRIRGILSALVLLMTGREAFAEIMKVDGADAHVVPGRIEAPAFHRFFDSDEAHQGNCGTGPVDAEPNTDPSGGGACTIAYTAQGEWLEYDIYAKSKAMYAFKLRVAGQLPDTRFHVELDGFNISGAVPGPQAGWAAWDDRIIENVFMACGKHRLRVFLEKGSVNFNYMDFWIKKEL